MSVNQGVQAGGRGAAGRTDTHCQYFESLEAKLLEESQKITNFMGKSLINDKSRTRLHLALSPSRGHAPSPVPPPLQDKPYMRRVKQLCQKIRSPKTALDGHFRSPQKPLRERYENERNLAYNITSIGKEGREGREGREGEEKEGPIDRGGTTGKQAEFLYKQQRQQPFRPQRQFASRQQRMEMPPRLERSDKLQRSEKMKRLYRMISDSKSLKDTISTESCKSLKSLEQLSTTTCIEKMQLQDFQILKYLAEGKFGSVYLVRHKATNFHCALKRIPTQSMRQDPRILTQRIREIKIQSYLDHPNIVQLYTVFVEEGDLYLLMELCNSGSLLSALRAEGRFSEERIRAVVKQVCYAVEFMHDNDILHRDLKPENILFHESIAKICDFGWSVNSPLLRDTLCGTPLYSSPEVVQKQQYDNKVDIWNIGVLTYQLLYGKVPFEIRTEEDLSKVVDDDIYFPRSKPASLQIKDFILRCLSKNPKERFTIARLIDHQFLQVADSRPN